MDKHTNWKRVEIDHASRMAIRTIGQSLETWLPWMGKQKTVAVWNRLMLGCN
jgi:hypothetical protein